MGYPVRPSGYVGWGSTGMTNVAEPTDAKKAAGWSVNEQPPSSYFNWIQSKQDEWLQYLMWRTQLEPIVDTDFNEEPRPNMQTYDLGAADSTGLYPLWQKSATHVYLGGGIVTLGDAAVAGDGASYLAYISKAVALPEAGQDFVLEAMGSYSGETKTSFSLGWASGALAFVATGQSGFWGVHCRQSGGNVTSIGMSHVVSSGYGRFTLEARGPTMIVALNGAQIYALPRPVIAAGSDNFGVFMRHASGVAWNTCAADKLTFKIRRPV